MKKEKYIATLVGCANGDSLGMVVEGWKKEQIRKYVGRIEDLMDPVIIKDGSGNEITEDEYGKLKYWTRDLKKGMYTDDTILTIALAKSLLDHGLDLNEIASGQLEAFLSQPLISKDRRSGAFGGTTQSGFKNLMKGTPPTKSGVIGGPGNAPCMRAAPLGIYLDIKEDWDILEFSRKVGAITHLDPRSQASGVVQTHAIYSLLNNASKLDFLESLVDVCVKYEKPLTEEFLFHDDGSLYSRLKWVYDNRKISTDAAYEILKNSSKAYESYPFTIFMFQKYWDDPIEGVLETVNYGGDCDTTGAMFGALAGARHGNIFPEKWTSQINNIEEIISLGERLYRLRGKA